VHREKENAGYPLEFIIGPAFGRTRWRVRPIEMDLTVVVDSEFARTEFAPRNDIMDGIQVSSKMHSPKI